MSGSRIFALIRKYVYAVGIFFIAGCAFTEQSAPRSNNPAERPQSSAKDGQAKRNMEEFIGMASAFIRRVGEDVAAKGYKMIFTDIGPESLERDAPDVFRELAKRSSGSGIQVRGFSRAEEKDGVFRDKQTGEKGVGLWMVDFEEDGSGGHIVSGFWKEGPGQRNSHEVRYLVLRKGSKWGAEPYRPMANMTAGDKQLLPGVSFFDGAENLSGQLVFQRLDYERPNGEWKCLSNVVYSLDLETKAVAQIAELGVLDARLVKVSDEGEILCLYDIDGGVNTRFFVHSVKQQQTKQVKFPDSIEPRGVAVLGNTVFLASSGLGPLYQYDFPSESLSEFWHPGLPVRGPTQRWLTSSSYPRTRFDEPGVLYFHDDFRAYYRWTQSTGELKQVPEFSYCMTADGNHIWLGERHGNFYPLLISPMSSIAYHAATAVGDKVTQPRTITNFKFPGGRSCGLDQLSPCGGFALLTVEAGGGLIFPGSTCHYIVDLKDGHSRMLLRNEYSSKRQDLGTVSRGFWVKKGQ